MKISIITVCKNAEQLILKTVHSVLSQSARSQIEYIVVDGKSSDNTVNLVKKELLGKNVIFKLISEKDNGLFFAMNKGISNSTGDIIAFINAGDTYINSKVIEEILSEFKADKKKHIDILYGGINEYNNAGNCVGNFCKKVTNKYFFLNNFVPHPSSFVRAEVFKNAGLFDTAYKIASDHEWFIRVIVRHKKNFKFINKPLVNYLIGGISSSSNLKYKKLHLNERKKIFKKYYSEKVLFIEFLIRKFFGVNVCSNIFAHI